MRCGRKTSREYHRVPHQAAFILQVAVDHILLLAVVVVPEVEEAVVPEAVVDTDRKKTNNNSKAWHIYQAFFN